MANELAALIKALLASVTFLVQQMDLEVMRWKDIREVGRCEHTLVAIGAKCGSNHDMLKIS